MNILKVAKKQGEKGMTHIDSHGQFINVKDPKFKALCMKDYLANVKSGVLPLTLSFAEYFEDDIERMLPIDSIPEFWFSSLHDREMAMEENGSWQPLPGVQVEEEGDNPC